MAEPGNKVVQQTGTDERELALRFQEQCFLMLNWEQITAAAMGNPGQSTPGQAGPFVNFVQLIGNKPYEYNNTLFRNTSKAERLLEISPAQISALVPQVDIYKEVIDPVSREAVSVRLPFDDIVSRSEINNMMETATGRGGGVGLKSFSWKTIGTNSANRYSFSAELNLHFQNIEDLFKPRNSGKLPSGDLVTVSFSDLILSQAKFRREGNEGSFTYNRDYYRIKIICGWNMYRKMNIQLLGNDLKDAIDETKIIFYLSLHSHELDFREDGSVDLKINYIAYTDSMANDPLQSNILYEDADSKNQRDRLERLSVQSAAQRDKRKQLAQAAEDEETKKKEEELEKGFEDNRKRLDEQVEQLEAKIRDFSYKRILDGMFQSGKIKHILVDQEFFNKNLKLTMESADATEKATKAEDVQKKKEGTADKNQSVEVKQSEAPDLEDGNGKDAKDDEAFYSNQIQDLSNSFELTPEGKQIVKFFYLGDMLDVVLQGMFNNPENTGPNDPFLEKELRILLGNITFFDYGTDWDSGMVMKTEGLENEKYRYKRVYTGKPSSINIAYIPISLRVFTAWFRNNVIEQQKTRFSFKEFLDSVVNDLVIRALAAECYERAPRQKARIRYKTFVSPHNEKREAEFKKAVNDGNNRLTVEQMVKEGIEFRLPISKQKPNASNDKKGGALHNYLLIYGDQENPYQLKGNIAQDRAKGIYHLFFGDEEGLVKRMKYKRDDMPYMRSANLYNNVKGRNRASKILRERYNVSIEMVGNNLFDVGGKINITPSIPGSGGVIGRSRVLKDLGIGGYFDIIEINNTIEDGKYSTDIDARWTARGDGTANIGDKQFELVEAHSISNPELIAPAEGEQGGAVRIKEGTTTAETNPDAARRKTKQKTTKQKEKQKRDRGRRGRTYGAGFGGGVGLRPTPSSE